MSPMVPGPNLPLISADSALTTTTAVALVSTVICAANPKRKAFVIYNNSANTAYFNFGPTASSASCAFIIPTFVEKQFNYPVGYTGVISAIRNAGTGVITVTELV